MEAAARWMPHALSTLAANLLHYSSLSQAARRARGNSSLDDHHEPLTFELMDRPEMRRARYKIKLTRCCITILHLFVCYKFLDELHRRRRLPPIAAVEIAIAGLLAATITLYLDENRLLVLRTPWNPTLDFKSRKLGAAWDAIRLVGGSIAVPIEEELFYHSWLYRRLENNSFLEVPLRGWRWRSALAANGILAIRSGMEWRSRLLGSLLFHWVIARRGSLIEGLAAHILCNLVIGTWVLLSGARHFW